MAPIPIRFGGYQSPASIHNRAAEIFGQSLTDQLGDGVQFSLDGNVTTSGRSGSDLLNMVEIGAIEMCYFSTSYLTSRVPEFALLDLPFMINDRHQAYQVLDGPLAGILTNKLAAVSGFRLLGFWDNGFRHFSNRTRAIHEPDDCKGLRIRTLLSDLHGQTFKLFGFEAVPLDIKDLVSSVESGAVDAQENPLTNLYNFGIHQHHRHITLSGHFFGAAALLCNAEAYAAWPTEVRKAVDLAAAAATVEQRQFAEAEDIAVLAKLNSADTEIVRLKNDGRARFVEAVVPIIEQQKRIFGDQLFGHLTGTNL